MVMIMKNLVKGKKVTPLYNHVVVRDLNDSSRYFPVKNEAGIIRANGSSFDDGIEEYNVASSIMGIGEVIAVGPEVKMVKPIIDSILAVKVENKPDEKIEAIMKIIQDNVDSGANGVKPTPQHNPEDNEHQKLEADISDIVNRANKIRGNK